MYAFVLYTLHCLLFFTTTYCISVCFCVLICTMLMCMCSQISLPLSVTTSQVIILDVVKSERQQRKAICLLRLRAKMFCLKNTKEKSNMTT